MSFGQELKDFAAGFQSGYKMVDSKEDRDLKRARADYLKSQQGKLDREAEGSDILDKRIADAEGGGGGGGGSRAAVAPPEEVKAIIDANVPENMRDYAYKMAKGESNFNPTATHKGGAAGLYQFMPDTAKQYGLRNPLDAAANTKAFVQFTMDNKK